ncbi:MAG TPA: DUF2845 domain-containing protein [Myxococcaceae bacterium]|nr:DUF2845 domain-containing protein [Myxococcaceae bacterium]
MRVFLAVLSLCSLSLLLPTPAEAATLRCGNQLVADGASKSDVLLKCGEPMAKESRSEAASDKLKQRGEDGTTTTTEKTVIKTIDEWTYNFGPNRLIQVVVFENGKLVDVRSGGYGR